METCGWEGMSSTPNASPGGATGAHSVPQQVGTWRVTGVQPTFLISLWTLAIAGLTQNLLQDGVPPPRGAAGQGRGSQVSLPRAGTQGLQVAGETAAVGGAVGGDTVETRSPVQVDLGAETSLAWEAAPPPQAGTLQQAETLEPSLPGRRASLCLPSQITNTCLRRAWGDVFHGLSPGLDPASPHGQLTHSFVHSAKSAFSQRRMYWWGWGRGPVRAARV